ncbi:hypothetical protein HGA91_00620 [candidate division WWE3 bacterium]|nr:hypothetical protein [candidate division WWE3 bacterium]
MSTTDTSVATLDLVVFDPGLFVEAHRMLTLLGQGFVEITDISLGNANLIRAAIAALPEHIPWDWQRTDTIGRRAVNRTLEATGHMERLLSLLEASEPDNAEIRHVCISFMAAAASAIVYLEAVAEGRADEIGWVDDVFNGSIMAGLAILAKFYPPVQ